tara:strand:+ start:771 stop:1781 length:1011 start_codon:yes stop_codon:yes gene_type:complete
MKKKDLSINEYELSLTDIFKLFSKYKIMLIAIIFSAGIMGYLYDDKNTYVSDFNTAREIETHSLLQLPPNYIFDTLINKNEIFFKNMYGSDIREMITGERTSFHNIFNLKFLSLNNFLIFLKDNNYNDFRDIILSELDNKNNVFQKRIGLLLPSDKGFKPIDHTQIVYIKHSIKFDGAEILTAYIKHTYEQSSDMYLQQKKEQFLFVKEKYKDAYITAKNLDIIDPFIKSKFTAELKTYTLTANIEELYYQGTKMLEINVNKMDELIGDFKNFKIEFDPIIDTAYTFLSKGKLPKTIVPNYAKGLIAGFLISIMIIFIFETTYKKKMRYKKNRAHK